MLSLSKHDLNTKKRVIARYEAISTQAGQLCRFALYGIEIINVVFVFIGIHELPPVGCLRTSQ
ncbi:MAG: hypothetical protein JWR38_733 [Mucilaginibacter sp.]|nr:hypothetical protein [Mucilaginibacter sp.]